MSQNPVTVGRHRGSTIYDSRYFTANFNYGLYVIMQVAELVGYQMPNCQNVFDWYQKIKKPGYGEFSYKEFGITDKESFERFYKM